MWFAILMLCTTPTVDSCRVIILKEPTVAQAACMKAAKARLDAATEPYGYAGCQKLGEGA